MKGRAASGVDAARKPPWTRTAASSSRVTTLSRCRDMTRAAVTVNGEAAATGDGAACLGNPLNSVLWLADAMSRSGTPLRAGECT